MNKIITIAIASLISTAALASGYERPTSGGIAEASSSAAVGSMSLTGNIGTGFAKQGTEVGAVNESWAGVSAGNGLVQTGAGSEGATYSESYGIAHHALGVTGGFALQTGAGNAEGFSLAPTYRHGRD